MCSDLEYIIRDGQILTPRLIEEIVLNNAPNSLVRPQFRREPWFPGPPLKLDIKNRGSLKTLQFTEDFDHYRGLGPTEVKIEAKAWGVSFRDIFLALGR